VRSGHPPVPGRPGTGGSGASLVVSDAVAVWLRMPGADPELPDGAQMLQGSADLPGAHLIDLVATMDRLRVGEPDDVGDHIGRELFRLVAGARELGLDPRDGAARGSAALPRSRARLGAPVAFRVQYGCFRPLNHSFLPPVLMLSVSS
jgi:hypothetical protein